MEQNFLEIYGARVHNLKNIDIKIPHNKLVVITGMSGSGKSSLAFDTIYAEGQRRYIETFSAYGRQFLGGLERPDVDKISGLSPVISIEQKSTNKNPRSTVGTITEINDFLRLWYAKAATAYSPATGEPMVQHTTSQIIDIIENEFNGRKIFILSPVVRSRKGHYRELFANFLKKGFLYARIDGNITELSENLTVERYKTHNIEIVIDKLKIDKNSDEKSGKRLKKSVELALKYGKGVLMVLEKDNENIRYFSKHLMCPTTGLSYDLPAPNTFSFNSPQGYCQRCKGLGYVEKFDLDKLVPDKNISIAEGAIKPLGRLQNGIIYWAILSLAETYKTSIKTPFKDLPDEMVEKILYGTDEKIRIKHSPLGNEAGYFVEYKGIADYLKNSDTTYNKNYYYSFVEKVQCPVCQGTRLKQEALNFKINGKNIAEISDMDLDDFAEWIKNVENSLTKKQKLISNEILKEIRSRTGFLLDVGLGYLSLSRSAATLSGGESQRIRLATQIGSQLVNVLYILDEPSIGLHQRDNERLINSLKKLRDSENTVIVVEHDEEMMRASDFLIDLGPGAGKNGGKIVASGSLKDVLKTNSLTAQYLSGKKSISVPTGRRKGTGKKIVLKGAKGHNLKNVDVEFPLGTLICVTGVSGSGKSTLINETLMPLLFRKVYSTSVRKPLEYSEITGLEHIDKVVEVDQSPLGRTPRSNPATYTKVFTEIRNLFAQLPEAQIRGYKAGRFSFNVKGGRCETCKGAGVETIEMKLLPDVYVTCRDCQGRRYNRETLAVRYKGKSIADVLDMTIDEAVDFFANYPKILRKIKTLQEVGLGYVKLGQPSTTLSGGESQRVKLAAELSKVATGKTVYILDEPTTGMHFEDIRMLLDVVNKLVEKKNTVIIIEHNLDVIKTADFVIDLGPEGGRNGGEIVFSGTPEELAECEKSYTGRFLKQVLKL